MKTVCEINKCCGCMACVDRCPKNAVSIRDDIKFLNAVIDESLCIDCQACFKVCQNNSSPELLKTMEWFQGWREDDKLRNISSSGGAAAALSEYFAEHIGDVCSCTFSEGNFIFSFAESKEDTAKFSGSKYVKSDPSGIYQQILSKLKNNKKVLFIGLPCQAAAVKKYVGQKYEDSLYLVDLICHGSPSKKVLQMSLKDEGYDINKISKIKFRKNNQFKLYINDDVPVCPKKVQDLYTYCFLNGVCYTENCYTCRYARTERVSDITLGDSWGSELPDSERKKGISLIMCQTQKGTELVKNSQLKLNEVNIEKAVSANRQLKEPSKVPHEREKFFLVLKRKGKFNTAVKRTYPKKYFKYVIKKLL